MIRTNELKIPWVFQKEDVSPIPKATGGNHHGEQAWTLPKWRTAPTNVLPPDAHPRVEPPLSSSRSKISRELPKRQMVQTIEEEQSRVATSVPALGGISKLKVLNLRLLLQGVTPENH
jgi:hypothetical protein